MNITTPENLITNYLFDNNIVFRAGSDNSLPPHITDKIQSVYQQCSPQTATNPNTTPINHRNIKLIDIIPILSRTHSFFEKIIKHAENFCQRINSHHSTIIEKTLEVEDPLKTLTFSDIGDFFEAILKKHSKKQHITDNEKETFKYLITGLFKMDQNLDAKNVSKILTTFTKFFHPDRTKHECDLYKCILNKERRIHKAIEDIWNIQDTTIQPYPKKNTYNLHENQLIKKISQLNKLGYVNKFWAQKEIKKELQSLKTLNRKDNYKEDLLLVTIKYDESGILETLINRGDFNINELKINNETPLIYAIQNISLDVIKLLTEMQDINIPGLEGKTPLQIAIACYYKYAEKRYFIRWSENPYIPVIESLLACDNLNVDSMDSIGMTALCHIALLPQLHLSSLQFMEKLIHRGANIDQPVQGHETVRSLLEKKLKQDQFSNLEILADNLEDIRNGVKFHGDEIVELIDKYNKTHGPLQQFHAYKKVEETINTTKTLQQKKSCRRTVLMAAIESKTVSFIERLLNRKDFTIDQLTTNGETPLNYAIQKGSYNIVKFLIDSAMANINTLGIDNQTPLQRAIKCYKDHNYQYDPYSYHGIPNPKNPYLPIVKFLYSCEDIQISEMDDSKLKALKII